MFLERLAATGFSAEAADAVNSQREPRMLTAEC